MVASCTAMEGDTGGTGALAEGSGALDARVMTSAVAFVLTSTFVFNGVCRNDLSSSIARRLVVYMIACNAMAALVWMGNAIDSVPNSDLCVVIATGDQFFSWASFMWSFGITYYLFLSITTQRVKRVNEPRLHACVWGICALFTALPFIGDTYGASQGWCWIDNSDLGEVWRLASFYGPLWLLVLVVCILTFRLSRTVYVVKRGALVRRAARRYASGDSSASSKSSAIAKAQASVTERQLLAYTMKKLAPFPMIFVLCWIFPTVRRVWQLTNDQPPEWLHYAHAISAPMNGILNTVFFYRRPIRGFCRACCRACSATVRGSVPPGEDVGAPSSTSRADSSSRADRSRGGSHEAEELPGADRSNAHAAQHGGRAATDGDRSQSRPAAEAGGRKGNGARDAGHALGRQTPSPGRTGDVRTMQRSQSVFMASGTPWATAVSVFRASMDLEASEDANWAMDFVNGVFDEVTTVESDDEAKPSSARDVFVHGRRNPAYRPRALSADVATPTTRVKAGALTLPRR